MDDIYPIKESDIKNYSINETLIVLNFVHKNLIFIYFLIYIIGWIPEFFIFYEHENFGEHTGKYLR